MFVYIFIEAFGVNDVARLYYGESVGPFKNGKAALGAVSDDADASAGFVFLAVDFCIVVRKITSFHR